MKKSTVIFGLLWQFRFAFSLGEKDEHYHGILNDVEKNEFGDNQLNENFPMAVPNPAAAAAVPVMAARGLAAPAPADGDGYEYEYFTESKTLLKTFSGLSTRTFMTMETEYLPMGTSNSNGGAAPVGSLVPPTMAFTSYPRQVFPAPAQNNLPPAPTDSPMGLANVRRQPINLPPQPKPQPVAGLEIRDGDLVPELRPVQTPNAPRLGARVARIMPQPALQMGSTNVQPVARAAQFNPPVVAPQPVGISPIQDMTAPIPTPISTSAQIGMQITPTNTPTGPETAPIATMATSMMPTIATRISSAGITNGPNGPAGFSVEPSKPTRTFEPIDRRPILIRPAPIQYRKTPIFNRPSRIRHKKMPLFKRRTPIRDRKRSLKNRRARTRDRKRSLKNRRGRIQHRKVPMFNRPLPIEVSKRPLLIRPVPIEFKPRARLADKRKREMRNKRARKSYRHKNRRNLKDKRYVCEKEARHRPKRWLASKYCEAIAEEGRLKLERAIEKSSLVSGYCESLAEEGESRLVRIVAKMLAYRGISD
ncbi:hypothetical protein AYI68_g4291 [Smittium mucronatum]|uniref:Uncharacterized protein n=1 Tax=Smittium mucronatum TaxID=133383 RepID=A0A1R0GXH7_9FUNG|nr:hypothetical protein AYI68_g4291 [Smittium mucronatum]